MNVSQPFKKAKAVDDTMDLEAYLERIRSASPRHASAEPLRKDCTPDFPLMDARSYNELRPPAPLVEGIIPLASVACMYGEPGIGKSFLAVDLACSIALGQPWLGRTVEQGSVVYVAAEGALGCAMRIKTWRQAYNVEGHLPVYLFGGNIDLTDHNASEHFVNELEERLPNITDLRLIIIDTLSRCMGGEDENATGVMSRVLNTASGMQRRGAAVLLLHHPNKSSKIERGSGALRGGVDVHMLLESDKATKTLALTCEKAKDMAEFEPVGARLCQYGGEHGSCIVITAAISARPESKQDVSDKKLADALRILKSKLGGSAPSGVWQNACDSLPNCKPVSFHKLRKVALDRGFVSKGVGKNGLYEINDAGDVFLEAMFIEHSPNIHTIPSITSSFIPPFRGDEDMNEQNDGDISGTGDA